jgi:hypothetical protein
MHGSGSSVDYSVDIRASLDIIDVLLALSNPSWIRITWNQSVQAGAKIATYFDYSTSG